MHAESLSSTDVVAQNSLENVMSLDRARCCSLTRLAFHGLAQVESAGLYRKVAAIKIERSSHRPQDACSSLPQGIALGRPHIGILVLYCLLCSR